MFAHRADAALALGSAVGSVYRLKLALKDPTADLEQAEKIIQALGEKRRVQALEGQWWKVELLDFEDQADAANALERDLGLIDKRWSAVLTLLIPE